MHRRLSYVDAVRLLRSDNSRLVELVDKTTAAALIVGAVSGHAELLAFFELRAEAVRLGRELVVAVRRNLRKHPRDEQADRLVAAHTVLVLTAYFEALDQLKLPITAKQLNLTRWEQINLAGGSSDSFNDLLTLLASVPAPVPSPAVPYEDVLEELTAFYDRLSTNLFSFIAGLTVGEALSDTQSDRLGNIISIAPRRALNLYQGQFLRLAANCPELFLWANLKDHQATRRAVKNLADATGRRLDELYSIADQLQIGLAGFERFYRIAGAGNLDYAKSSLAITGRQELNWPIIDSRSLDAHYQLRFPVLADAYINPGGRIAEIHPDTHPESESWWLGQPYHSDIQATLAGLLISPGATDTPTVVLGHPGAGKSVLSRILAGRLCESGFLVVNVQLRLVPPNAPIQHQVERGIEIATGEHTTWPELVRSAGDVTRVVILDGLDELVQSSQVSRSDYLELVQDFQRREAGLSRPTAVVVTSRTVVAARTRFPIGTIAIRLEAFNKRQVARWLTIWNDTNRTYFLDRGLQPLSVSTALRFESLAIQPLLLTMLALYDADDNALQSQASLDTSQLYERLLTSFARREIRTRDSRGSDYGSLHNDYGSLDDAVERELQRLAVTATGMFNRGRQWISSEELNADLTRLIPFRPPQEVPSERQFHDSLSQAEVTVGRFFFVHESRMTGDRPHHTYEFMHATFGEYLVARFVTRALVDLQERQRVAFSALALPAVFPDDGLLFALLSFEPLSTRPSIIGFVVQLILALNEDQIARVYSLLVRLFRKALYAQADRAYRDYEPVSRSITSRCAFYSANLLLIAISMSEDPVEGVDLYGHDENVGQAWRQHVGLWWSQFASSEAWSSFSSLLRCEAITQADGQRRVVITKAPKAEPVSGGPTDPRLLAVNWNQDLFLQEVSMSDPYKNLFNDLKIKGGGDPDAAATTTATQ